MTWSSAAPALAAALALLLVPGGLVVLAAGFRNLLGAALAPVLSVAIVSGSAVAAQLTGCVGGWAWSWRARHWRSLPWPGCACSYSEDAPPTRTNPPTGGAPRSPACSGRRPVPPPSASVWRGGSGRQIAGHRPSMPSSTSRPSTT